MERNNHVNEASQKNGKKKGFFALLKESIVKSNDGCGPGCGCYAVDAKKAKGGEVAGKGTQGSSVGH